MGFNRFHVMKRMNEKLDALGRPLVRRAESEDAQVAIKGTRGFWCIAEPILPRTRPTSCRRRWR